MNEGFLGMAAPRYADVVVLLEIGMGVALLIGAVLVRTDFTPGLVVIVRAKAESWYGMKGQYAPLCAGSSFSMRQPVGYPIGSHRGFRTTKTPK